MERLELPKHRLNKVFHLTTAADQFRSLMEQLGVSVVPHPQRGSHDCEFWVREEHKEYLRKIQGKRIIGVTRDFVIRECTAPFGGYKFWRVSYLQKERVN